MLAVDARFDIAHTVVTEIADQTARETRQPRRLLHLKAAGVVGDPLEGIVGIRLFDEFTVDTTLDRRATHAENLAAGQTDERIASPGLAALHRFEQKRVRAIAEFEIGADRRIQVAGKFARQRNVGVVRHGVEIVKRGGTALAAANDKRRVTLRSAPSPPLAQVCGLRIRLPDQHCRQAKNHLDARMIREFRAVPTSPTAFRSPFIQRFPPCASSVRKYSVVDASATKAASQTRVQPPEA